MTSQIANCQAKKRKQAGPHPGRVKQALVPGRGNEASEFIGVMSLTAYGRLWCDHGLWRGQGSLLRRPLEPIGPPLRQTDRSNLKHSARRGWHAPVSLTLVNNPKARLALFLLVVFHHRPSGNFFRSLSVPARFLSLLLNVLVLTLFFLAGTSQVFSFWHR
jgi:hypothetical protein